MAGINLKLLKEFKAICSEHPEVPFTMQAFDMFLTHISK